MRVDLGAPGAQSPLTAREPLRYAPPAVLLHWVMAGLILFNLGLGFFMEGFPPTLRDVVKPLHITFGATVLVLLAARIAWRLLRRPPALLPASRWARGAAYAVHVSLYLLMAAMPLTGIAFLSCHPAPHGAGPRPPKVWGLFDLPLLQQLQALAPAPQKAAHAVFLSLHFDFGLVMAGLLILHVAAPLKHEFMDGQAQFERIGL